MRNSADKSLIVGLLITFALVILSLFLFQSAWLKMIQYMLKSNQDSGLPVSSTPMTGFSIPTAAAAVPLGVESSFKNLAITVTRVTVPANYIVGNSAQFLTLQQGEEYLMVDISVRCLANATENCRLTEFDFGVKSRAGFDYHAELSGGYDLKGLFEGGEIEPGKSLKGSLIFVIKINDRGLVMHYPQMFGFGSEAKFILTD